MPQHTPCGCHNFHAWEAIVQSFHRVKPFIRKAHSVTPAAQTTILLSPPVATALPYCTAMQHVKHQVQHLSAAAT